MTDKPTLKPCPFCGGEANLRTVEFVGCEYVKCENCGVSSDDHGKGSARTAWNTRAAPKVKALEWSHCDEAKGGGAKYNAYEFGREGLWRVVCYPHEDQQYVVATDVTRSDAKAAAQTDFERRILDALE